MRCRHLMEKMWNLFLQSQCLNKTFSTSPKKKIQYIWEKSMSLLLWNLLFKNIYNTMSSFMWNNELFNILKWWLYLYCIFLFSFLTYVFYSKNIKFFRNADFFSICDWLSNHILRNLFLRLTYPKLYFEDQIFAISVDIRSN